jgi:hypothetical protein
LDRVRRSAPGREPRPAAAQRRRLPPLDEEREPGEDELGLELDDELEPEELLLPCELEEPDRGGAEPGSAGSATGCASSSGGGAGATSI